MSDTSTLPSNKLCDESEPIDTLANVSVVLGFLQEFDCRTRGCLPTDEEEKMHDQARYYILGWIKDAVDHAEGVLLERGAAPRRANVSSTDHTQPGD